MHEYDIRLIGHDSPDGQLVVNDLVRLGEAFEHLFYRLTRATADRAGLGRTDAVLERLSEVRVALRPGSTVVAFHVGDLDALEVDPLAEGVDEAFWQVVVGVRGSTRPDGVSDSVAEAVGELVDALIKASPSAEISTPGREPLTLSRGNMQRDPWRRLPSDSKLETTIHGVLEMVDLRSSRFRLRDLVGNAIDLIGVRDATDVAKYVGGTVDATGLLAPGSGTTRHRMEGALVSLAADVATRLRLIPVPTVEEAIEAARAAPQPPSLDLSTEELEDFLAAIHG